MRANGPFLLARGGLSTGLARHRRRQERRGAKFHHAWPAAAAEHRGAKFHHARPSTAAEHRDAKFHHTRPSAAAGHRDAKFHQVVSPRKALGK